MENQKDFLNVGLSDKESAGTVIFASLIVIPEFTKKQEYGCVRMDLPKS